MKIEIQKKRKEFLIILIIFTFSMSIRLFNIFEIGIFHWDSGYFIETSLWLIGQGGMPYPWDPPIYSIIVAIAFLIFGIYDWVAILISAIFGSLTVIVTYLIAKELFNFRIAILSSFFLAINQLHIIYSRTALTDSTFTFFFSLSILFFLYSIRIKKTWMFLIYGIVLGITQNVKYNGFQAFLITTSFFLIYFIYTRFRIHSKKNFSIEFRGIILAFIMMILLHIPWIFMLGIGDYMKETGIFSLSILSNIDINNIYLL